MTTKRNLLAAIAGIACLVQPAFAQEGASGTTASANDDWTGFYFGGRLGLSNSIDDEGEFVEFDTNLDGSFGDTVRTVAGANAFSPGFCGGRAVSAARSGTSFDCGTDNAETEWAIHAGYDYDFGAFVVGIVGEYGKSDFRDRVTAFSTTPANYVLRQELGDTFAVRGRVGFDLDGTLLYGTGGAVYSEVQNSFTTTNAANAFTNSGDDDEFGYRVGGGVERKIGNFSIGAQYLYTNIEADPFTVRAARGTAAVTNPFILVNPNGTDFRRSEDALEQHNISVTASFRF